MMTYEELKKTYKDVFDSVKGREVLRDLAERCYFKAATYSGGDEANAIFIKEGRRSVYLEIDSLVNDPIEPEQDNSKGDSK